MNLQTLRDNVRAQLDLDEEDLPNTLVDLYLREGFERTMQEERQWPFYATEWAVTSLVGDEGKFPIPTDVSGIVEVTGEDGLPLAHIGHSMATQAFTTEPGGVGRYFSIWGTNVYLWPSPTATATYNIRGWRLPADWVSQGAATEVDADSRLHLPLIHYACSRAYAQQEDEILERSYLESWSRGVDRAKEDIMRPQGTRPIVLNEGILGAARRRVYLEI